MLDIFPETMIDGAVGVARGVTRLFCRHDIFVTREVALRNTRRADLMGVDARGEIVLVEIKCSRADLMNDHKWVDYLDYCDRFYWAVPAGFDVSPLTTESFGPDRTGIIIADGYGAEILRPAALHPLAPARRKVEVQRLARLAMRRLALIGDPGMAAGTAYQQAV